MAISRNARRFAAKRRKALAEADALNTEKLRRKQALIARNCAALGRKANAFGKGGISWLDPSRKPLGFTRKKGIGQLGKIGKAL